ncbi:ACP S-malonyltransferase [Rhodococcus sp. IEGM 1330]|uniref:ACP S-malonyltransferase n=1 Tax=Rhodococcus sp. IEGM 1330 TaxID=3082225 RepID=UPI0029531350|nr:ACP S-malonyltransferase [Rhodococcus sp. IEGM 1330]MDV8022182.1 ACP S-malonyltransferase [Rhodococcus sp. IEGM 1330]
MTSPRIMTMFPGQGSQRPGMASWVRNYRIAMDLFERAESILGMPLLKLCTEGTVSELRSTDVAQPAIVTTSLALAAVRRARGIRIDAVAGHSLGEFTALAVSGVLDEESTLNLVRTRGELMAGASQRSDGAMSAIIGLTSDRVDALCACVVSGNVSVANYNQPTQTVVSGDVKAVAKCEDLAYAAGATKVVRLKVSGAFHSVLMADISEELAVAIAKCDMKAPEIPLLSAVTADYASDPARIRSLACEQLMAPVRWVETINRAVADGYSEMLELGPGNVLTGFARRIAPQVTSTSVAVL